MIFIVHYWQWWVGGEKKIWKIKKVLIVRQTIVSFHCVLGGWVGELSSTSSSPISYDPSDLTRVHECVSVLLYVWMWWKRPPCPRGTLYMYTCVYISYVLCCKTRPRVCLSNAICKRALSAFDSLTRALQQGRVIWPVFRVWRLMSNQLVSHCPDLFECAFEYYTT